jgi:hypothetical protein
VPPSRRKKNTSSKLSILQKEWDFRRTLTALHFIVER